jgi:hypothetical protein
MDAYFKKTLADANAALIAAAIGTTKIATGTYTGDEGSKKISVPTMRPRVVYIYSLSDNEAQGRWILAFDKNTIGDRPAGIAVNSQGSFVPVIGGAKEVTFGKGSFTTTWSGAGATYSYIALGESL